MPGTRRPVVLTVDDNRGLHEVYTLAFQSLQYGRASAYSVILFIVMLSLGFFYVRALTGGGRKQQARG